MKKTAVPAAQSLGWPKRFEGEGESEIQWAISCFEWSSAAGKWPGGGGPVKAVKKTRKTRKALKEFLGGDYLSKDWVTGNISFILYLAFLAMIYIANTYYTEKKFKSIELTKVELKELRYKYITTKSILMFQGRQSEISKKAVNQGLLEAKMPPFKILYSGESIQQVKR